MDENKVQSTDVGDTPESPVDTLLRFREKKGATAAQHAEPPLQEKQETKAEEKPVQDPEADQKPSLSVEEALKKIEALETEKERYAKQAADSRKWGNEQNMKLKALMKDGVIDEETAAKLASNEAALNDSPLDSVMNRWQDDLKRLRPLMAKRGEDVDAYQEAFHAWVATHTSEQANAIADELLSLPEDDWTAFMLDKGKDYFDSVYSEIKKSGSLMDAYRQTKEQLTKQEADFNALKEKYEALKAEMKAELKSGYGKKASLHGSSGEVQQEMEEERTRSSADILELQRQRRLGLVR